MKYHGRASTLRLLYCGALTPLAFWATTIICGFVLGDYNHLSRMVSELGTMGTPSQFLFTAGMVSCSVLSVLFVIGLRRTCQHMKLSTVPVWAILSYSISIAGAGLFPLPLRLHGMLGMPSVFLILSPLTALVLWPKPHAPAHLKVMASLAFAVMSLGFLAFAPSILMSLLGLKQRFFHLGWSVWFIYLSVSFIKAPEPIP
jgi:hypothetical membrane protein